MKIANSINHGFELLETLKLVERMPAFLPDHLAVYPELAELEQSYVDIRAECEALLAQQHDNITNVEDLFSYTKGGLHAAKWKSFMLKLGDQMITENCKRCPILADLLEKIPRARNAFLSILEGHQYIYPHWGYYYGYLRYHFSIIIPDNNADNNCLLRVCTNDHYNRMRYRKSVNYDSDKNKKFHREVLDQYGKPYYWKDGEGYIFNDNYLHDARNDSDKIRVVLWVDLDRPLWGLPHYLNQAIQAALYRSRMVKEARLKVVVE